MGKSAPSPPNPYQTAAAQTSSNQATAAQQQQYNIQDAQKTASLNRINQTNAAGSTLTYNPKTGAQTVTLGADPEGTAAYANYGEQQVLQNLDNEVAGGAGASNAQAQALQQSILARLAPQEQQQTSTEQTELADQGITPGSVAYENAFLPIQQQQNDLALGAVQTADTEQQQLLQDQIGELGAFGGAYQTATNPTFASVPTVTVQAPSVAGTDVSSLVNQSYQDQVKQAQANNSALGGLLGSVGGGALTLATGGAGLGALGSSLGLPGLLGIGSTAAAGTTAGAQTLGSLGFYNPLPE